MNIIVSAVHKALVVPWTEALHNLMPHSRRLDFKGSDMLAVPHGIAETQLLRNFQIPAPAPILHHYAWAGGTPYDVQRNTAAMLTQNKRAYVLNAFGTGKTKSALWSADFLMTQGEVRKVVVVAPLSTLRFTWAREAFATVPHRRVVVLHGDRAKRIALAEGPGDIFVVNHDGLEIVLPALRRRGDIDLAIIDELAVYRNGRGRKTKVLAAMLAGDAKRNVPGVPWAWGMTGSPTPNEPTDAHSLVRLITPGRVDPSFIRFRDATMQRITSFKWAPKPNALDIVQNAMQPSVRYTLNDVVELPDLTIQTVDVEQGPRQQDVYKKLVSFAHAGLATGDVTAMNAAGILTKLLQVSCGWVYTTSGQTAQLDNDARTAALLDAIAASERKFIVFAPFTHCINGLEQAIKAAGHTVMVVDGNVSATRRSEIFNAFQNTSNPKVLLAHPGAMAHGVTLTAADTIAWYGPITSLETFDQANARITRIGQKNKQLILLFQGSKVEREAYARLRKKQGVQNLLLQMFEEGTDATF